MQIPHVMHHIDRDSFDHLQVGMIKFFFYTPFSHFPYHSHSFSTRRPKGTYQSFQTQIHWNIVESSNTNLTLLGATKYSVFFPLFVRGFTKAFIENPL